MAREFIGDLVAQLQAGKISRREFARRAAALGLSAGLIGQATRVAAAQEASPAASPGAGGLIGRQDVEHLTDTSAGTVKFYSSWPLTGASEQIGGDSVESVRMAIEDFGGAAGGFAIEYNPLDDGIAANNGSWDAAREAENATTVVNDEDAMVYIATYNSGAAAVSIPILNQAEPGPMAMISPANTYPGLTKESPYNAEENEPEQYYPVGRRNYMRVVPADDLQGPAAAAWAFNSNGARRAYVLHDNQLYGKGVATAFRDVFESLGGEILGFEAFDANAPDYQALMTSVANAGPDILYVGAIVNLNPGKLLQDMRSVMSVDDVTFLGPDGLINQAFIDGAGEAAAGAYVTFAGLPPQALEGTGADWYTRIKERIGHEPDAYSVYAYECAVVAIQALDEVQEKDRVAILDAMLGTESFEGLLGTWGFLDTGDTSLTTVSVSVIEDGAIAFQEKISAPTPGV